MEHELKVRGMTVYVTVDKFGEITDFEVWDRRTNRTKPAWWLYDRLADREIANLKAEIRERELQEC